MESYTLIHAALLCEAQTFIEKLKLKKINSAPKIYANANTLVLIGGVGKDNTVNSLEYIFQNYNISKVFNIGTAGCSDKTVEIGSLFCSTHKLDGIDILPLITNEFPVFEKEIEQKALFDMEGEYFYEISKKYTEDIYIFKVVSDHLDIQRLDKEFVKKIIFNNFDLLAKYIKG